MRVAVLGTGSWGTALGATLASKEFPVTLWDVDAKVVAAVADRARTPGTCRACGSRPP